MNSLIFPFCKQQQTILTKKRVKFLGQQATFIMMINELLTITATKTKSTVMTVSINLVSPVKEWCCKSVVTAIPQLKFVIFYQIYGASHTSLRIRQRCCLNWLETWLEYEAGCMNICRKRKGILFRPDILKKANKNQTAVKRNNLTIRKRKCFI